MRIEKVSIYQIMIMFLFLVSLAIAEGLAPSVLASTRSEDVDFTKIPEGKIEHAGRVELLDGFQLWHYSGGYWGNEVHNIKIYDDELVLLASGQISHEELENTSIDLYKPLPAEVFNFLENGGSLEDVQLRFTSGRGLNPESLFVNPTYTITYVKGDPQNSRIHVKSNLAFFISPQAFVTASDIPGLRVDVWQPMTTGHGMVTFSIYTRNGQHLGNAWSSGVSHPIAPNDILNAQGHLRGGKPYTITTHNWNEFTRDGSEIQIGYNTFASGGAVGMHFYFPINVDFYIKPELPLDTIRVRYIDEDGQSLLPDDIIEPTEEGPYTVMAKNIPDYNLISPESQTVMIEKNDTQHVVVFMYKMPEPGGPIAEFTWSPVTPKEGDPVQFTDRSTHPDGVAIVSWQWRVDYTVISTNQHPVHTFSKAGTYRVYLRVMDANGKTDTISYDIHVTEADPKYPPKACIQAPATRSAGDSATIVSCSTDPDGEIVLLEWSWDGQGTGAAPGMLDTNDESGTIFFMEPGAYRVFLTVTDNDGLTDTTHRTINVLTPVPFPFIDVGGTLKENRKVILDASRSFGVPLYPIDTSRTEWSITPLDGQAESSIKFKNNTNIGHIKEVLFKEPGMYDVKVKVYNTYGSSGEVTRTITIAEDLPPVVDFTVQDQIFRDPNNDNKGTFILRDLSYSIDGDFIQQRIWKYLYDSQNDGRIDNDTWITIDTGNNPEIRLEVTEVGRYYFWLEVVEGFGQETIPEFITPQDYKRAIH